ncbi:sigma-fimbrial biogenesis chaperone protein [Desulfuromonas sp. DDH964]|nr:sigma-fimbrial biogenesis chaperone protein [Desulfuromonas sp. DDH964]
MKPSFLDHVRSGKPQLCIILGMVLLFVSQAFCGEWRVIPIRLDFDQRTRSGVITVTNDGEQKISFDISALAWTQDAEGKDQYAATDEVIFFPKLLTIGAHEERVIRVGIKAPAILQEKTYRLFIREQAAPQDAKGSTVAIAIQFAVPIFSAPAKTIAEGKIVDKGIVNGLATILLKNTGNVHFRVTDVALSGKDVSGDELFSKDLPGWYLLPGTSHSYAAPIPKQDCERLRNLDILLTTDKFQLTDRIDVDSAMCTAN